MSLFVKAVAFAAARTLLGIGTYGLAATVRPSFFARLSGRKG
jgi:hypothetical protein